MGSLDLRSIAERIFVNLNVGRIGGVAYDTAWVARLTMDGRPLFPRALRWLLRNQRWDGSWGSEIPYIHDRVLSTAAAILALGQVEGERYTERIARATEYLHRHVHRLDEDPFETIGAEMLVPMLIEECQERGIDIPNPSSSLLAKRASKLSLVREKGLYGKDTTMSFSLEFLGNDIDVERLRGCILPNGSIGCSPSATSFLLERTTDTKALRYLRLVSRYMTEGGFPSQMPFETFEWSWMMYNYQRVGWTGLTQYHRVLSRLNSLWREDGVSWCKDFLVSDADTTAMTFMALRKGGYRPDPSVFERYEGEDGYRCWDHELNPSVSVNVHVLDAVKDLPRSELPRREEIVEKVVRFLRRTQVDGSFWNDKWHISPYYSTGHGILALTGLDPSLVEGAVSWILRTQKEDGGWGHFDHSTVEETSYAMQALMEYSSTVEPIDPNPLALGAEFLATRVNESYESLWVAKGLYCPINVVLSTALSAMFEYATKFAPARDSGLHEEVQESTCVGLEILDRGNA